MISKFYKKRGMMLKMSNIGESQYDRNNYWPIVPKFKEFSKDMTMLLNMPNNKLKEYFTAIHQQNFEQYSKLVIDSLTTIYSCYFCYKDSPLINNTNVSNELYFSLIKLKLILEDEMINKIIKPKEVSCDTISTLETCCEYLATYIKQNVAVNHQLFDFIAEESTFEQMQEFLLIEVIRNEVVDDEIAMMIPGLQHAMKQVIASNLWDECGNGVIDNFHTSWLYQLVDATDSWDKIIKYRENKPWFTALIGNSFNSLLTNKVRKFQSYGHFLTTEAWAEPHFAKIIRGMNRLGIDDKKVHIYFTMHLKIDPYHTNEMLIAIAKNKPVLISNQLYDIVRGVHQAVAAGEMMYSILLDYFKTQASVM